MAVTAVAKPWLICTRKTSMPRSPTLGSTNPNAKDFFNREENQYECIKEGSNKAILLFKGEKTDSKGYINAPSLRR